MAPLILDNATLWIGDGSSFDGHLVIQDGVIERVGRGKHEGPEAAIDLEGLALSPGMIDLMVLGGFGLSFARNDPMEIARKYLALGVTSCQFCTGNQAWDRYVQIGEKIRHAQADRSLDAAGVIGVYLEGPFQHPESTGANLVEHSLPPTADNVARVLAELGDALTMINVSPGVEGDAEAVRCLVDVGQVVSMAHSSAAPDRVVACVEAGTTVLGHAWDNNAGLIGDSGVQQPTLEHVAFTDDRVWLHLICDGVHVHPILMKLMLRCRGAEAICITTDCGIRAGLSDGAFTWDDGRTMVKTGGVCRTEEGHLAGSGILLPDMFRNFVQFTGLEPHVAIQAVTGNPARSIGHEDRIGLLAPGRAADLAAWDSRLRVQRVWRRGEELRNVSRFEEVSA